MVVGNNYHSMTGYCCMYFPLTFFFVAVVLDQNVYTITLEMCFYELGR